VRSFMPELPWRGSRRSYYAVSCVLAILTRSESQCTVTRVMSSSSLIHHQQGSGTDPYDLRLYSPPALGGSRFPQTPPQGAERVWEMWKTELFANSGEGVRRGLATGGVRALGCHLRRARSATRTKSVPAVVGGSRKSVGPVDESATGSAKLWSKGPRPRAADSPKVLLHFRRRTAHFGDCGEIDQRVVGASRPRRDTLGGSIALCI
jgi:hypothetical protein